MCADGFKGEACEQGEHTPVARVRARPQDAHVRAYLPSLCSCVPIRQAPPLGVRWARHLRHGRRVRLLPGLAWACLRRACVHGARAHCLATTPRPHLRACRTSAGYAEHGVCSDTGACICDAGWNGAACDLRACPGDCAGHGTCDGTTGKCVCEGQFTGPGCDFLAPRCPTAHVQVRMRAAGAIPARLAPLMRPCACCRALRSRCRAADEGCAAPSMPARTRASACARRAGPARRVRRVRCLDGAACVCLRNVLTRVRAPGAAACPMDCMDGRHGVCKRGKCSCFTGYAGEACERHLPAPPMCSEECSQACLATPECHVAHNGGHHNVNRRLYELEAARAHEHGSEHALLEVAARNGTVGPSKQLSCFVGCTRQCVVERCWVRGAEYGAAASL